MENRLNLKRLGTILFLIVLSAIVVSGEDIIVTLKAQIPTPTASEVVSFGVPFAPGKIYDINTIAVWDGANQLPIYIESLVPWRGIGKTGIRSVLVQFTMDFTSQRVRTVTVRTGTARTATVITKTPVVNTLTGPDSLATPRIFALLPGTYLCNSWVAGPLLKPAVQNTGKYKNYDEYYAGMCLGYTNSTQNISHALTDLDSGGFREDGTPEGWLFDRVTSLYRGYVRVGSDYVLRKSNYSPASTYWNGDSVSGEMLFRAAYRYSSAYRYLLWDSASCVGVNNSQGLCRGLFKPKNPDPRTVWCDSKYDYTQCLAIHYMLTGDARYLTSIRDVIFSWKDGAGIPPEYVMGRPWTERHVGIAWVAYNWAWEMLGRSADSVNMVRWANAIVTMVNNPPDGWPADGAWRHVGNDGLEYDNWCVGVSTWMSSCLLEGIFGYWLMTGDSRMPILCRNFTNWLDINGVTTDFGPPGNGRDTCPFYWTSSANLVGRTLHYPGGNNMPAGDYQVSPSDWADGLNTTHNMELLYGFAMGYWFGGRTAPYMDTRASQLWHNATSEHRGPLRLFNWVFRNTPALLTFLDPNGPSPEELLTTGIENSHGGAEGTEKLGIKLNANPNPFKTAVSFQLSAVSKGEKAELKIFDFSGKLVSKLKADSRELKASFSWNASRFPSGIYVAKLTAGTKSYSTKVLLMK